MKSNMDLMHIEREKDQLASEVSQRKQELETTKKLMDSQQAEEAKLRKIISEASAEITRQKKELEKVCVCLCVCVCVYVECLYVCMCVCVCVCVCDGIVGKRCSDQGYRLELYREGEGLAHQVVCNKCCHIKVSITM